MHTGHCEVNRILPERTVIRRGYLWGLDFLALSGYFEINNISGPGFSSIPLDANDTTDTRYH